MSIYNRCYEDEPAMQAMIDHHFEWLRLAPWPHCSHAAEHLMAMADMLQKGLDELQQSPDLDDYGRQAVDEALRQVERVQKALLSVD